MRIAMVSEHASPLAALGGVDAGGQNVHVAQLALTLAEQGCEVVIHTRRDDPDLPTEVQLAAGVVVHHVDAGPPLALPKDDLLPHMDRFADELEAYWRRRPPQVVHAHFWMSGMAALRAGRAVGIPVVHTFHALGAVKRRYQGAADTSPGERLEIERDIARRADRIVATCSDEVFELLRIGADRERLTIIPCGVDVTRFTPDRAPGEPGADPHRILTIGRLVPRKGVGNMVSALAHVPDARLAIAGGADRAHLDQDPDAVRLVALAEAEGVADRIDLLGRVGREDVPALLRSAAVVVCAPWYEPFGMVALEAMACGVPVVATAVGGMIDSVVDDVTGVHVPPRDPDRLADTLRSLLDDPDRRARLGEAGVRRARRRYDWNRIGAATLDVYTTVARTLHGRPRFGRIPTASAHIGALAGALSAFEEQAERLEALGERLAGLLLDGGRLLVAGNGGSAAQAQHLTGELVGRYRTERVPLSALCLHGDTSTFTAIGNDYGPDEVFARQVRAHGRPGDVLLALSTSGRSANMLAAAEAARSCGIEVWSLTGAGPNPLSELADEALCVPSRDTATTQELHMVAVHVLCGAVDREVALRDRAARPSARVRV